MTDHENLREAIRAMREWADNGAGNSYTVEQNNEFTRVLCDAAESTLPKTKMVEAKIWVNFDERGKIIACGPLGESCGSTFEMRQQQPKDLQRCDAVFIGKAEIPA